MTCISRVPAENLLQQIENIANCRAGMTDRAQRNQFKWLCQRLQESDELDSAKMKRLVALVAAFVQNHFLPISERFAGVGIAGASTFFDLLLAKKGLCSDEVKNGLVEAYTLIDQGVRSFYKNNAGKRVPHKLYKVRQFLGQRLQNGFSISVVECPRTTNKRKQAPAARPTKKKRREPGPVPAKVLMFDPEFVRPYRPFALR